ncbi:MAG: alpha/beta fold hydrolase [Acidimicrobiia bacterium]
MPELPFGGHQQPLPDHADLTLPGVVSLIVEFLVELDLHDVTLVSNDWGGAQLVVHPGGSDRVANLALVSCEAFDNYPPGVPGRLLCLLAALPGGVFLTSQLLRPRILRNLPITFGNMSLGGVPNEQMMRWLEPLRHQRGIRRDLEEYLRAVPTPAQLMEWAEGQRSFGGSVLIVWARDDKLMPPRHAELLAGHFTDARLRWVDDSRTLIPIDQPDRLADHLIEFLDQVYPQGGSLSCEA